MILTTYDKDLYEKTLKEDAREEIIAELNQLTKYLLKAKRYSDLERATEDIEYQKTLLKELGIESKLNNPYPHPVTDHRLRCSASPLYQSRDLFVRKIPLPHRYNQITPFLCAPRNLYFLYFHHIIPNFYFYSNIPIHIVESDTNITHSYKS